MPETDATTETPRERVDALSPEEQREVLVWIVQATDAHGPETPPWLRSILHDYSLNAGGR